MTASARWADLKAQVYAAEIRRQCIDQYSSGFARAQAQNAADHACAEAWRNLPSAERAAIAAEREAAEAQRIAERDAHEALYQAALLAYRHCSAACPTYGPARAAAMRGIAFPERYMQDDELRAIAHECEAATLALLKVAA